MINDDFYPVKIRKSKLYIDATLKDIEENYHIKVKKNLIKKIKILLKKIIKK